MLARKADGPLTVRIPDPPEDRPAWRTVAALAAAGFVVGIGWPRLMGVRMGPSLPEASPASASAAGAIETPPPGAVASVVRGAPSPSPVPTMAASTAPGAPLPGAAAPPSAAALPATAPAPTPAGPLKVSVLSGPVASCKTADGDTLKGPDCGKLRGLDAIVGPRLHKLAECPEAATATGRLQLVVHLDFAHGWMTADLGHSPGSVQGVASLDPLLACARADLLGATIASVVHDNDRYSVGYSVVFDAGGTAGAPEQAPAPGPAGELAEGTAQVVWEVALVRDAPKTGKVLVRLQRGTQVRIGAAKDGWYPVKYGDGNAGEGWVYRGAIGK